MGEVTFKADGQGNTAVELALGVAPPAVLAEFTGLLPVWGEVLDMLNDGMTKFATMCEDGK